MTQVTSNENALFELSSSLYVDAAPADVYDIVSDLARSGEWSPECVGGEWTVGTPRTVGSVFRGENLRSEDVVGWAPVVRGTWFTESEVVAAEPGRAFQWAMRDSAGRKQQSVWGFAIEPQGAGSRLTHHFRMITATEGIRGITSEMSDTEREAFFAEWGAKVEGDLGTTLGRIKDVVEEN
ncbi:SRPBCC family protein [Streptomyces sp. NPDC006487]|uniref:SRPBCC family protein n=1 Tax=Streptomyces sp. NPDC006487 TaxID=3364748 RepID=UPI0036AA9006